MMVSKNTVIAQRKESPTEPHARRCATPCEYRCPKSPFSSTAANGNRGMSRTITSKRSNMSPLQQIHLVDVGRDLPTEDDDDDG